MSSTSFAQLARLGEKLEGTKKRSELATLLATFLRSLDPEEIPAAVRLTIGQVFPEWDGRSLNVSWRTLMAVVDGLTDAPPDLSERLSAEAVDGGEFVRVLFEQCRREVPTSPPLSILEVYRGLEEISQTRGRGSRTRKEGLLRDLLERASPVEAKYLSKIVYQEMRHGVSEGIMLTGIAQAAGVQVKVVRRANQLWGDLGEVALVALTQGEERLREASARLFRPIKPMLAQTAQRSARSVRPLWRPGCTGVQTGRSPGTDPSLGR